MAEYGQIMPMSLQRRPWQPEQQQYHQQRCSLENADQGPATAGAAELRLAAGFTKDWGDGVPSVSQQHHSGAVQLRALGPAGHVAEGWLAQQQLPGSCLGTGRQPRQVPLIFQVGQDPIKFASPAVAQELSGLLQHDMCSPDAGEQLPGASVAVAALNTTRRLRSRHLDSCSGPWW